MNSLSTTLKERIKAVEKFKKDGLGVTEAAELWDKMFPFEPLPAEEGYRAYSRGFTIMQLNHLYQVIGGDRGI